ncbi:uncharacterized protein EURHEDRAFT_407782 [Aspergillus ruber CBS 135680]|uniref:Uncharacterized protein n=1 Tax=Aspergillus ruber (strain CBS 135680) TaxID=1388766 RepID=A0A017SS22_ASPRC|nr:uncharacterized protein EURHEDRAFT_407782 [Aspergillus ruber CBS 135680]EYE99783.1 hypothetical protein EURHEDRAFT_407782 [Aspergillus ruber CBS 135680]
MHVPTILATFLVLAGSHVAAYNDNCNGSGAAFALIPGDCDKARDSIDATATYKDGKEFSKGTCYVKYATNGSGDQPIKGQDIINTMNNIQQNCNSNVGSYGTGNCEKCHVTINYRVP